VSAISDLLDRVVDDFRGIDVRVYGEESPLRNPWDEFKDQVQNEKSPYWSVYLEQAGMFIRMYVEDLQKQAFADLAVSVRTSNVDEMCRRLLKRLLTRAEKESIEFEPFDFEYFYYPLLDFTGYAHVRERVAWWTCNAKVYSAAAPFGEVGFVDVSRAEDVLTKAQFEQARADGWPEKWPRS